MGIRARSARRVGLLLVATMAAALLAVGTVGAVSAPEAQAAPVVPSDTTVGYMVYDRAAKKVVAQRDERRQFRSASLVKLLIALDYLQTKGSVTAVPAADRKLLESMLRSSDDDAASTLWVRGGYEKVIQRMVPLIGLTDTLPPTDRRYWGYTALSAADVVATYNYLLDRAPASYRDFVVGNLEQFTRCAADGFNQGFGLPRAVAGVKAVKQGWSGYGAKPTGPACVEGAEDVPATVDSAKAPEEAPQAEADSRPSTLAAPTLDLSSRAMHTSGLVDGRGRVIVVLTLSPKAKSFDDSATTITTIARTLRDEAVKPVVEMPVVTPPAPSPIDDYASRNTSKVGPATSQTYTVRGGTARDYRGGTVYHSAQTGAHLIGGTILSRYRALGGPDSILGLPTSDELAAADGRGRYNDFAGVNGSALLWNASTNRAWSITGSTLKRYRALGETRSVLGYPTTDTSLTPDGKGRYTHFAGAGGSSIYYNPARNDAYAIYGAIRARWSQLGWERSSVGYPTSNEYAVPGGRRNDFDRGTITWNASTGATRVG